MLGYLKWLGYSDAFLATMRGINVITGLLGTVAAPLLERKIGSARGGGWSIWYAVILSRAT